MGIKHCRLAMLGFLGLASKASATTSASLRTSVTLSPAPSSFPRQASTSQRASRRPPLPPLRRLSLPVSAWRVSRRRETFPVFPLVLLAGAGYNSFEDEINFV